MKVKRTPEEVARRDEFYRVRRRWRTWRDKLFALGIYHINQHDTEVWNKLFYKLAHKSDAEIYAAFYKQVGLAA